jgi:PAS domain-containing protein
MKNSYIQVIALLDKFASSFSRIGTISELAQGVEKILEETYGDEYTELYLYDPDNKHLRLLLAKGFNKIEIIAAEKSAMDRHPGMVFRSGRMIYIADTFLDDNEMAKSSERSFIVRSRLYLPVMNDEQVVGAFGIVDSKPNAYNNEDIAVLSFICNMAGAICGNILNQNLLKSANEQIISLSKLPVESPNPFLRVSHQNILLYANRASKSILDHFRLTEGEIISNEFLIPILELFKSDRSVEWEITAGNSIYSLLFTTVEGKEYVNIYGRDISKRKSLENELIKKEAKYAKMFANINDVVVIINEKGINTYKSPNLEELFGWKPEELVGNSTFDNIHPDDRESMLSNF